MKNELGAVCCLFNPLRHEIRVQNYRAFRAEFEKSGVPLLTVECVFGDADFELGEFADVIRVRSNTVVWQKERLLTIGFEELFRRGFTRVMWIDADLKFDEPDWPALTLKALESNDVVQCFTTLCQRYSCEDRYTHCNALETIKRGERYMGAASGGAWAFRADFLRAVPLYEHHIVGCGDVAYAQIFQPYQHHSLNLYFEDLTAHYMDFWKRARPIAMEAQYGWVPGNADFLCHGTRAGRGFDFRRYLLYDFDPYTDLSVQPGQPFEWAADKPELRQRIFDYFVSRDDNAHELPQSK